MSETLKRVQALVGVGEIEVSRHGLQELAADAILLGDVINGLGSAEVVEDYPRYAKGPTVLVLERDNRGEPIHVLWGIARDSNGPAVLVTAYRPDTGRWSADFMRRRKP